MKIKLAIFLIILILISGKISAKNNKKMNKNLQAFLLMIRKGEGTLGFDGYRKIFGGSLFTSFADHPRKVMTYPTSNGKTISSNAAGAYQFLSTTWDELNTDHTDFSPANQDAKAIKLLQRIGAYDFIINGNIQEAIKKAAGTWASLPYSPYGQPTQSLPGALAYYKSNGGVSNDNIS